jgi:hypothetical protein
MSRQCGVKQPSWLHNLPGKLTPVTTSLATVKLLHQSSPARVRRDAPLYKAISGTEISSRTVHLRSSLRMDPFVREVLGIHINYGLCSRAIYLRDTIGKVVRAICNENAMLYRASSRARQSMTLSRECHQVPTVA